MWVKPWHERTAHRWTLSSPTERDRTAQPERLHSAEVSNQQVGIQQLQLGGELTSTVGAPTLLTEASRGLITPSANGLHIWTPPSPVSWPSTPAALRRCCTERTSTVKMHGWMHGREGRTALNGYRNTPSRGEILSVGNLYCVNPPAPPFFLWLVCNIELFSKRMFSVWSFFLCFSFFVCLPPPRFFSCRWGAMN